MQSVDFKCELREPALAATLCARAGAICLATLSQTDTYYRIPDAHLLRRQSGAVVASSEANPGAQAGAQPLDPSNPLAHAVASSAHHAGVEWVFYTRPQKIEPRVGVAILYSERAALARFGSAPMPLWVIVQKERVAWALGDVRIHLDDVVSLGRFIEFEARVSARRSVATCVRMIARARALLAPAMGEPLSKGYSELMAWEQESGLMGRSLPPPDLI